MPLATATSGSLAGRGRDAVAIHGLGDVQPAVADIDTDASASPACRRTAVVGMCVRSLVRSMMFPCAIRYVITPSKYVFAMALVRSIISIFSSLPRNGIFHGAAQVDLALGAGRDHQLDCRLLRPASSRWTCMRLAEGVAAGPGAVAATGTERDPAVHQLGHVVGARRWMQFARQVGLVR